MKLGRLHAFVALVISTTAILISISGCATRLLVANGHNANILHFNGSTGAFVGVFVPEGSGGLAMPWGMVFGPDRKLYVANSNFQVNDYLGQVHRYDGRTGAFVDVFVPLGSGGLSVPRGLTFGPDCSLYVTNQPPTGSGGVLRYQGSTGAFVDAFVPSGSGGLQYPSGLVFGPDDNLYVTDSVDKGRVLRYHGSTGAFLDAFVEAGSGDLKKPTGMVFGPDGNLYVASERAILRYVGGSGYGAGAFLDAFVPESAGLLYPIYLEFGPDGDLYVTSGPAWGPQPVNIPPVRRYNGSTGAFIEVFVPLGSGDLAFPTALAFTPRPGPVTKQIDNLVVAVEKLRLPADIEKGFKNPLQNARAAIDAGSLLPARNQLGSFTDTVRANTGNLIPVPQANRLIFDVNAIKAYLPCS